MLVNSRDGVTDPIVINKGVLQGETLSPLLFAIFIADLEEFLINKGIRGVSVNHLVEIVLLAYADDIVIFADSYINMKKTIKALAEYCDINKLEVNVKKTKVVLFQKGGHGHKRKHTPFYFKDQIIEYVCEYVYLGIIMAQTAMYKKTADYIVKKAKAACTSTISTIHKLKINSWNIYSKLFHTLVNATLMHGSEVYAINHLEELEKIQLTYFKRLLNLAQNTPNYAVRLETGKNHIALTIFEKVLNWIDKINNMPVERYPKIYFLRQLKIHKSNLGNKKYNWVSLICELFFKPLGIDSWLVNKEFAKIKIAIPWHPILRR